jgi:type I restriction enzyme S subunit
MPTLSLNASKKTKHTPAGEIPVDWGWAELGKAAKVITGSTPASEDPSNYGGSIPFVTPGDVSQSTWIRTTERTITEKGLSNTRLIPAGSTVVVCIGSSIGKAGLVTQDCGANQQLNAATAGDQTTPDFLFYSISSATGHLKRLTGNQAVPIVNKSQFSKIPIPLPPLPEQIRIAAILSTWDRAIETLESLIAAKDRRKQALMQQLITGKKRLPGFDQSGGLTKRDRFERYPGDWEALRLGQITTETGKRNSRGGDHPVLSCTKHHGLVLSEEYFGRRVHAEDTSNYRLVHRGEFAYATNHIEEGSIGYQDRCDTGLVSPIYTVFKSNGRVSPNYLFRVLKSPLFLHLYQVNTSASVDRRGSLRYKEFSQLPIWLPSRAEQDAITSVFDTIDRELALHRQHLEALRTQKRGLMQLLLTGRVRVKAP